MEYKVEPELEEDENVGAVEVDSVPAAVRTACLRWQRWRLFINLSRLEWTRVWCKLT